MLLALELPSIVTPEVGLVFWTFVVFIIVLFLLRKMAWGPILGAVEERQRNIVESLAQAELARDEMAKLQADNQKLLNEAKEERARMLKEAKEVGEKMVADARDRATVEYKKKVDEAVREIENQKQAALTEVKNQAGILAIEIAEKVLRKELNDPAAQKSYAAGLVNEFKMN